jgi:hypothetical protein
VAFFWPLLSTAEGAGEALRSEAEIPFAINRELRFRLVALENRWLSVTNFYAVKIQRL